MKKVFIGLIALMLISALSINVYAMSIDKVITDMDGVQKRDTSLGNDEGIMAVINDVIGLLQLAGTGIAVVTVTILGAKYMLSSVDQKAEIKNKRYFDNFLLNRLLPIIIRADAPITNSISNIIRFFCHSFAAFISLCLSETR